MTFRRCFIYGLVVFISAVAAQNDLNPFDCLVKTGGLDYDLTLLEGEHTVSRTFDSPPTTMVEEVRFNLCADLEPQNGVAESDQCPSGTRACLTKTNKKDGQPDRIVAVIPLAQSSHLDAQYSHIPPSQGTKGLSLLFHGRSYPPEIDSKPQSLNLTLLCSTSTRDPSFVSYQEGLMKIKWSAPSGCEIGPSGDDTKNPDTSKPDSDGESVGSSIGWFFLMLIIVLAAYFAIGMYYNYSTYGATGADLIPHRDFWREVPYMLRDVFEHLCTAFRPRHSTRGGYIAV